MIEGPYPSGSVRMYICTCRYFHSSSPVLQLQGWSDGLITSSGCCLEDPLPNRVIVSLNCVRGEKGHCIWSFLHTVHCIFIRACVYAHTVCKRKHNYETLFLDWHNSSFGFHSDQNKVENDGSGEICYLYRAPKSWKWRKCQSWIAGWALCLDQVAIMTSRTSVKLNVTGWSPTQWNTHRGKTFLINIVVKALQSHLDWTCIGSTFCLTRSEIFGSLQARKNTMLHKPFPH